jgi:hypothetical protein
MNIELILNILKDYGALSLMLVVFIYIIIKGQFTFQYPRRIKNHKDE